MIVLGVELAKLFATNHGHRVNEWKEPEGINEYLQADFTGHCVTCSFDIQIIGVGSKTAIISFQVPDGNNMFITYNEDHFVYDSMAGKFGKTYSKADFVCEKLRALL